MMLSFILSLTRVRSCATRRFFSTSSSTSSCPIYAITSVPKHHHQHVLPLTLALGHVRGRNLDAISVSMKTRVDQDASKDDSTTTTPTQRSPSDSWLRMILPLTHDTWTRTYQLFDTRRVRTGRIFEDLDAFAADIAYRHCGPSSLSNLTIVTAGLDRAAFYRYITLDRDLALTGCVTWTGRSSMEVRVELASLSPSGHLDTLGQAHFQMVARDKIHYNAVRVPAIIPCDVDDQKIWKEAEEYRTIRRSRQERSLEVAPPDVTETDIIHKLYLMSKKGASEYMSASGIPHPIVSLPSTAMSSTVLMQGQDRNIHNKMFGGHLMRLAYELAWSNAYVVTKEQPVFEVIDDVRFVAPVEIGSVVQFLSSVIYTDVDTNVLVVHVDAQVIDPKTGSRRTTNSFFFGFRHTSSRPLVFVMPASYSDSMRYLDGRRRACAMLGK